MSLSSPIPEYQPSLGGDTPLARVISVSGSQALVQFSGQMAGGEEGTADVSVGTFLGISNGRSLVIGALCDISLDKAADGTFSAYATGRVDLLGEIVPDDGGTERFERGVGICQEDDFAAMRLAARFQVAR